RSALRPACLSDQALYAAQEPSANVQRRSELDASDAGPIRDRQGWNDPLLRSESGLHAPARAGSHDPCAAAGRCREVLTAASKTNRKRDFIPVRFFAFGDNATG